MSHDITKRADGSYEFVSAVTRGWHDLGQLSDKKMTAAEAMTMAQLAWKVEQVEVLHQVIAEDGETELHTIPDHYLVRREDNKRALGVMSSKYQMIQNTEMFGFVDKMIGSGKAAWDTAGSLAGGRVVFMQIELEGRLFLKSNPNDQTIKRVLFFNSHDGSKALTGMITPVRVVCQNTLNAALGSHSNCFKIKHTKNYSDKMDYAAKILGLADAYFSDLQAVMDTLDAKQVDLNYAKGFVDALFPAEDKDKVPARTTSRRDEVLSLFSGGMGNNGRTGWDLYNSVTEYVDHHSAGRMTSTRLDKSEALANVEQEARFERAIFGSGATLKQKALDLLLN